VDLVLPAEWVVPSIARERVGQWLRQHGWSPAHIDDLVLAVSEAVSNSVEHGYRITADGNAHASLTKPPGTIEIHGQVRTGLDGERRVELTIRDHGSWIPPASVRTSRGNGLPIMRACTDELIIRPTAAGTTVILRSRPIPPPMRPRS
jgi:anti-sigma regulatory factor (Ser/Thr protein kinase)